MSRSRFAVVEFPVRFWYTDPKLSLRNPSPASPVSEGTTMNASLYPPRLKDAIHRVRERLEQARSQYQVDVLAFFIGDDPFMPSFLRCLAAPGADVEEAASHFCLKPFPDGCGSGFVPDTATDPLRDGDGEVAARLIQRDRTRNLVFGDFVTREQIVSRAWFVKRDELHGQPEALLTVNYRRPRDEQEWQQHDRAPLQELFAELVRQLEAIETLLKEEYSWQVWNLIRVLNVALPTELGPQPAESCPRTLERILTLATEALCPGPPNEWCGTIYLLDASRYRLQLKAQVGHFPLPPQEVDVEAGEGVVSWVAVREQAVYIPNLETAPKLQTIQRDFPPGMRRQLAVPMVRVGRVIGVLSLESPEADVFSLTSVGFLMRVASLAAVQVDMEQLREERDLYLEAVYASKRIEMPVQPLPSFEELVRTAAKPVPLDF